MRDSDLAVVPDTEEAGWAELVETMATGIISGSRRRTTRSGI